MSIIACSGKRTPKVAKEITDKGYCSTKGIYYGLFSKAVSSVRQPIESLFNRLIEETDIQRASKVRSTKGLLTFVCGRIAAAFIYFIFQLNS